MFVKEFTDLVRDLFNIYKPDLLDNFHYDINEDNDIVGIYYYLDNDEIYFNIVVNNLIELLYEKYLKQ